MTTSGQVYISSVRYAQERKTLELVRAVGKSKATNPCRFVIKDPAGTLTFQEGQPVQVVTTPDGTVWGGYIDTAQSELMGPLGGLKWSITCKGMDCLAQFHVIMTAYTEMNPLCMIKHICDDYLAADGVTYDSTSIPDNCIYTQIFIDDWDCESAEPTLHSETSEGGLTSALDAGQKHAGAKSLKLTTGAGGVTNRYYMLGGVDMNGLTAGKSYTFTGWAYVPSGQGINLAAVFLKINESTGGTISNTPTAYDTWQQLTVTRTIGAGATYAYLLLYVYQDIAAKIVYYDDLSLEIPGYTGAIVYADGNGSQKTCTVDTPANVDYTGSLVAKGFDDLSDQTTRYWYIDPLKKLWMIPVNAVAAPFTLQTGDVLYSEKPRIQYSADQYRNKQIVLNSLGISANVESYDGDGNTRTFTLSMPVNDAPTIQVNGVQVPGSSIGISGTDTGKSWYWNKNNNTISMDKAISPLQPGEQLTVSYNGQYKQQTVAQDSAAIAARAALSGTSGVIENVSSISNPMTATAAAVYASNELATYSTTTKVFTFTTMKPGLREGQSLTVNYPYFGLNNVQMLITNFEVDERATVTGAVELYYYKATVVIGPLQMAWPLILGGKA